MALLALIGQMVGVPLDRYAAPVIVVLIVGTGWTLLADGMRVLRDASLDAETMEPVRAIIQADPAVTQIRSLAGRNAGRFGSLEADVALRVSDLDKAHAASHRIEQAIRNQVPHVQRVRNDCQPQVRTDLIYAVPLAGPDGAIGEHPISPSKRPRAYA